MLSKGLTRGSAFCFPSDLLDLISRSKVKLGSKASAYIDAPSAAALAESVISIALSYVRPSFVGRISSLKLLSAEVLALPASDSRGGLADELLLGVSSGTADIEKDEASDEGGGEVPVVSVTSSEGAERCDVDAEAEEDAYIEVIL